ncbi:SigE family RNA polymerase sigma factor [Klenkia soli]|uniref:SigE family RNA polymerase sigma factor n=1 Tax=Klenkia soli TaxID=1052260 RepID=UPI000AF22CBE|nr:SigE family RNA polymerase sigma factor [Klenkia soli]
MTGPADFDAFVRAHHVGLVRYAVLLCGSRAQAEDIVHDVLTRVYPRWADITDRPGSVLAYVRRAVTNEHVSWRRRWSTRTTVLVDDLTHLDGPTPAAPAVDDQLWHRLPGLPARQRAALVLRYYEDLDDDEIAECLACRPGTVRSLVSRGLATLRAADDIHLLRGSGDD